MSWKTPWSRHREIVRPQREQEDLEDWLFVSLDHLDIGESHLLGLMALCHKDPTLVTRCWNGLSILDRLVRKGSPDLLELFCKGFPNALVTRTAGALTLVQKVHQLKTLSMPLSVREVRGTNTEAWKALIQLLANSPSMRRVSLLSDRLEVESIPHITLAMQSVPTLTVLRLQSSGIWLNPQASREINDAIVYLLQQNTIKELAVDGCYLMDHTSFYAALATNTSLLVLDIPFFVNTAEKRAALLQALQTNMSLESLPCWSFPHSRASPAYLKVWYWLFLNRLGRQRAFDPETTKDTFVQLLSQAIHYTGDRLRHPDDSLFQVQMAFGLLFARPSLWTD